MKNSSSVRYSKRGPGVLRSVSALFVVTVVVTVVVVGGVPPLWVVCVGPSASPGGSVSGTGTGSGSGSGGGSGSRIANSTSPDTHPAANVAVSPLKTTGTGVALITQEASTSAAMSSS